MQLPAPFGKYELLERIATGGMAEVFLARSFGVAGFQKRLVLKRLRPELADDPRFVQMFINEAKIGVHLNHPNVVSVFEQLDAARFPIEEMRVTAAEELDLAPTGDGNNTSAFVCRAVRGGSSFSEHAFGLAIDVNPFHNPYVRGDVVLPELASTYLDRGNVRDGMLTDDSAPVGAFAGIGWEWGGAWDGRTVDPMHFSPAGA